MVTGKRTGRASSLPTGVGIGVAAALGWTMLWAGILAKLISMETLPEEAVGYGAMIILLSSAFLGAMLAYGKIKSKRLQAGLLTGAGYYLSLLAMTAMFFGGQYTGMGVTGLLVFAGSGTAVLIGVGPKKGRKLKRYQKLQQITT